MQAIGITLGFLVFGAGMAIMLEILKASLGEWIIIPLLVACISGLTYIFYKQLK